MPWRLPYQKRGLFCTDEEGLVLKASFPSGVRLRFHSDTSWLAGVIVPDTCPADKIAYNKLDLCLDGQLVRTLDLAGKGEFVFSDLPNSEKVIELWLPCTGKFQLRHLQLSLGANLQPAPDQGPRWITYGSSITMCVTAQSPTYTWPAIVARSAGLSLTSLGFGGECYLDILVARIIRDLPADLVSFCTGTNALLAHAFGERVFRYKLTAFILTIRDGHPDIPIAAMSPIYCNRFDPAPGEHADFWRKCRQAVREVVENLKAHGDRNLHFVDGRDLLSGQDSNAMQDDVHPSAQGYKLMGKNFLSKVLPMLLR